MVKSSRYGGWIFFGLIGAISVGFVAALASPLFQSHKVRPGREFAERPSAETPFPVTIRQRDAKPWIDSGKVDAKGDPVMVGCATCHDTRTPDLTTNDASKLDEFHRGMKFAHGGMSCLSCHNSSGYDTLRTADGQSHDFSQSMQLCSQCHGPQFRDYQNGSHGGMTGFWDLKQGPRERNHCIDCHDPHHPAYPKVMPVFPPKPVIGEAVPAPHGTSSH